MDFFERMSSVEFAGIVLVVVFGVVAVMASCHEDASWERFSKEHNCVVIGKMDGSLDFNGDWTSGKIGYRCDDGKEYWKNK